MSGKSNNLLLVVVSFCLLALCWAAEDDCSSAPQFSCGFQQSSPCPCWRQGVDGVEDDVDWKMANQVSILGFSSIPRGRPDGSGNGTFAYAIRDGNALFSSIPRGAMLISKALPCIGKGMRLRLYFWKTALIPELRICYMLTNGTEVSHCLSEIKGLQPPTWVPWIVDLAPIKYEVQIVIQAHRLLGLQALEAIDDIGLDGEFKCEGKPAKKVPLAKITKATVAITTAEQKKPTTPAVVVPQQSQLAHLCPERKDDNDWTEDYSHGLWHPCSSLAECNPPDGARGGIWTAQGPGTFVLETQMVKASQTALSFEYSFPNGDSFTSKLKVCIDDLDNCPFSQRGSSDIVGSGLWNSKAIPLDDNWRTVYFVVTNLKKTDRVRLRRIHLGAGEAEATSGCMLMVMDESQEQSS